MEIELKENLDRIIQTLEGQGMMTTKIAHAIGYTTTRQLYNTIDGTSMLSTKAVMGLIVNLNVNPIFLFLGKGDMFLTEESEIEILRRENQELIHRHNEAVETIMALTDMIKKLEKKNDDLIEISSAALKYHKGQQEGEKEKSEIMGDNSSEIQNLYKEREWKQLKAEDVLPSFDTSVKKTIDKLKMEATKNKKDLPSKPLKK
jgi:hypothetical protein